MKRIVTILVGLMVCSCVIAVIHCNSSNNGSTTDEAQLQATLPKMKLLNDEVHDLGTFSRSEVDTLSTVFTFMNEGGQPLIIYEAKVWCNCTRVTYPHKPIAPGASDSIIVVYDTKLGVKGFFQKTIEMTTNCERPDQAVCIKGVMTE